jgi:hypothetical protein
MVKRIRNCIGQNNLAYFARFIFFHAVMCTIKFLIVSKVFVIEFSYIVEKYNLKIQDPGNFLAFVMRYLAYHYDIFFFLMITGMTSLALIFFFVNISSKYIRDLTINEEFKYDSTRRFYENRLENIGKYIKGKPNVTYNEMEKLKSDFTEVEVWLKKHKKLFGAQKLFHNLFRMLVI